MGWLPGSSITRSTDNGALLVLGAYPLRAPKRKEIEAFSILLARLVGELEWSIVSGNGSVIGNALLEGLQQARGHEALQYLVNIPTKQHGTIAAMTHSEKSRYFHSVRQELIAKANTMVIISGEKFNKDGELCNSDTVMAEYNMGIESGRYVIPVAIFGGVGRAVHARISQEIRLKTHAYTGLPDGLFAKLANTSLDYQEVLEAVFEIAEWIVETKLGALSRRSSFASDKGAHSSHRRTSSNFSSRAIGIAERPVTSGN